MNEFIKVFFVIFAFFVVALILNSVDRLGTPLLINMPALTTNWINLAPFLILIFLGFFYLLGRR